MRLLLDTHVFMWWDDQSKQLSSNALLACQDPQNILYLSAVSIWEMQIKLQVGKLSFSIPLSEKIQNQQTKNGLKILPIRVSHIFALEQLPMHHRDPFDRLLLAQTLHEKLTLVSHDTMMSQYNLPLIW